MNINTEVNKSKVRKRYFVSPSPPPPSPSTKSRVNDIRPHPPRYRTPFVLSTSFMNIKSWLSGIAVSGGGGQ